jgi:hypothetical protein
LYLETLTHPGNTRSDPSGEISQQCLWSASQGKRGNPREVCASRSLRAIEQLPLRVDLARSPSRIGMTGILRIPAEAKARGDCEISLRQMPPMASARIIYNLIDH